MYLKSLHGINYLFSRVIDYIFDTVVTDKKGRHLYVSAFPLFPFESNALIQPKHLFFTFEHLAYKNDKWQNHKNT